MKKKFTAMAALAVLLVLVLAGAALAEETPDTPDATLETEVSIGFEGAVYFVDMGAAGMDVDFGSQMIPKRGETAYAYAPDGNHTLRVCDRRAAPGKWSVHAVMTPMESEVDTFLGVLQFFRYTATDGITLNSSGTPAFYLFIIPVNPRKIMEAKESLEPGEYDLTVPDTRLQIQPDEIEKVKPLEYSATVTWTLVLEP